MKMQLIDGERIAAGVTAGSAELNLKDMGKNNPEADLV